MEKISVLVLDHDPVSLLTISNTLAKFNFRVLPFRTAAEALDSIERGVAKDEELDLVVAEVHPRNTAMDTLVLLHHILNALEVPLVTMCAYDHVEAVSERMNLGSCFNVLKPLDTETVNILMNKALQHRSRRVLPEGSSIGKKTQGRIDSSSTKTHGSDTEEDEEPDVFKSHGCSKKLGRFIWSRQLHEKFLQAVEVLGESATPRKIRRHMNVKNLNLTLNHIASHLQKHRLREQRLKQEEENYKKYASMKKLSDLLTSASKVATPKPINHLTTTQMQTRHGVASSVWDKYPGGLWAQVEESSAKAETFKTNACKSAVFEYGTNSVWDKYEESLPKRLSMSYKREFLPVKSKAIGEYADIADIYHAGPKGTRENPTAASETGYGAPASVPLESSGSESMITSLLQQLKEETSRAEAAGNNVNLGSGTLQACYTMNQVRAAVNLQKDTMDQARAAVNLQKDTMDQARAEVNLQKDTMDQARAAVNLQKDTLNQALAAVNVQKDTMNQACTAVNVQKDTMNQACAAVNRQKDTMNQVHTAVPPLGDTMNWVHTAAMVADGLVDVGSDSLLDGTGSSRSTAEKTPSDPFCSWEEVEAFWLSELEGQEQQGTGPDDLLQLDDAWNQALQPANVGDALVAQMGDAPTGAQEPATDDALVYDPEFSIDDVQVWIPEFAGDDYGMLF